MSTHPATGLRNWRPDSRQHPTVRIGIVLAEDAMTNIEMQTPDATYDLTLDQQPPTPARRTRLSARLNGDQLTVSTNDNDGIPAHRFRLHPATPKAPSRNDGVLVKNLVAGRGFHWQKRVDQTLAGTLELLVHDKKIILVNELPLETYLAGVITSEMSSQCPIEFLKAQCITARSWLLAFTEPKHNHEPFDRCNDDCCQRYQGTGDLSPIAIQAVESTHGLVLIAGGKVVDANYSKSCGGIVELPEHIWGQHKPGLGEQVDAPANSHARRFLPVTDANLSDYLTGPWLQSTDIYCSPNTIPEDQLGQYLGKVDETGHYFRWTVTYSHDELLALLKSKGPEFSPITQLTDLRVTKRGISARATELVLSYLDAQNKPHDLRIPDQYRIRQLLHKSFLYSSAFLPEITRDLTGAIQSITLTGAGWGHGAGLCQIGALGMSLRGLDHATIVKHYFPGAELTRLY